MLEIQPSENPLNHSLTASPPADAEEKKSGYNFKMTERESRGKYTSFRSQRGSRHSMSTMPPIGEHEEDTASPQGVSVREEGGLRRRGGYQRIDMQGDSFGGKGDLNFITVDWFSDRNDARQRKRAFRDRNKRRIPRCLGVCSNWYYNIQGWFVLLLVGISSAVTGAVIHQLSRWFSGLKFGYCSGYGFWVSRTLCCAETTSTVCPAWSNWSEILLPTGSRGTFWFDYFIYVTMGTIFALTSSYICSMYSPLSLGSGIAGTKVVLGGFIIKNFLAGTTLLIKSVGLVLAVASGLSLGLEGPMVHIACCFGAIFTRMFPKYKENEAMKREIFSASAAAGVTAAFGAPLGGVLFSLEAMSSYFPHKTMWRSFWCAISTAVALKYFNPYADGSSRLVQFMVFYRGESWMWFELIPFAILGIVGGIAGAVFIRLNVKLHAVRRNVTWFRRNRTMEVGIIAAVSCLIAFSNVFAAEGQAFLLQHLFSHCTELEMSLDDSMTHALCDKGEKHVTKFMLLLLAVALGRFVLTTITFGSQVPSGLFMPTLAIGACVGRLVGWLVSSWHDSVGDTWPFEGCQGRTDCIFPSLYAVVGAAAFLGGTTRLTVSLAVIMLELTGGLDYIVPLMVAVVPSKWVGDAFGKEGIFDQLITLQGYPHINQAMELGSDARASDIMSTQVITLTKCNETIQTLEEICSNHGYQGYPIVGNRHDRRIIGLITRRDIESALRENEDTMPGTNVAFSLEGLPGRAVDYIDLSNCVDKHPIIVRPTMPADRVLDMFKGLGLRYIFVSDENGALLGVIKKKDMLKHIRVEKKLREQGDRMDSADSEGQSRRRSRLMREQWSFDSNFRAYSRLRL